MNKRLLLLALIVACCFCLVGTVHAQSGINFTDLPNQISDKFSVDTFTAQLLASAGVVIIATAIVGFTVRSKSSALPIIAICDFLVMGICVALAWLPVWTFTMCILMVALLAGAKWKDLI